MSRNGEWRLDQLKCSICTENYRNPRILPCLHSFCTDCLAIVLYDGNDGSKRVCCPDCATEHRLPSDGVAGLPVNVYLRNVLDITGERINNGSGEYREATKCDLCSKENGTMMMSHCAICKYDLCLDCDLVHRRETHHSPKHVHRQGERNAASSEHFEIVYCLFCNAHRENEARFFCETCTVSICDQCSRTDHDKHTCVKIEDSSIRDVACSARVLKQAKTVMNSLQESVRKLNYTLNSLRSQNEKVASAICSTIDAQMHALQEHKRTLLQQLEDVCTHKEESLLSQITKSESTLEDIALHYTHAAATVKTQLESKSSNSVKPQSLRMLETSITAYKDVKPVEDDYLKFCPNHSAGKCNGFEMKGRIDGVGPSPIHSSAHGPGLVEGVLGQTAHFTVSICDRHGQLRALGGDSVFVSIQNPLGQKIEPEVRNESSGIYAVSYVPTTVGEHRLAVTVEERNVKSSPFVVPVVSKDSRQHSGMYHCCTFCTSGGDKNVSCGCGGNMPGGFSGCGHGHPGHPGSWHWSCCGRIEKDSMCSKSS